MVEQTARLESSLSQAYGRMKDDLQMAARVQKTLLPQVAPQVAGSQFAWVFKPCEELAGDTLNVFPLGAEHVGMYLLDVSGHGVAAALLAVQLSRVLSPLAEEGSLMFRPRKSRGRKRLVPPAEVAAALNRRFPFELHTEQFFTLVYGVLNCRTGEFRYVCAGHPGPAFAPRVGPPHLLQGSGLPIGVGEGNYKEYTLRLEPGDRLYLYSDGLTEAMNADRHRFGNSRLLAALSRLRDASLDDSLAGAAATCRPGRCVPAMMYPSWPSSGPGQRCRTRMANAGGRAPGVRGTAFRSFVAGPAMKHRHFLDPRHLAAVLGTAAEPSPTEPSSGEPLTLLHCGRRAMATHFEVRYPAAPPTRWPPRKTPSTKLTASKAN